MPELPAGIEWTKVKSANGQEFEVGRLPGKSATSTTVTPSPGVQASGFLSSASADQNFGITVNWPVDTDSSDWVDTSDEVKKKAAITRYALYPIQNPVFYTYILCFTNTKNYDYFFSDETGDSYEVNTYESGDHSVRFNSSKPTIVYIRGEI